MDQDPKYGAMQTRGLNPISREELAAIQAQQAQQAEWTKRKPPAVEDLRDEVERLRWAITELKKSVRTVEVWTLSLLALFLLVLFGMEW